MSDDIDEEHIAEIDFTEADLKDATPNKPLIEADINDLLENLVSEINHSPSLQETNKVLGRLKQAIFDRLASEAVTGVKPDGSIMLAIPLGRAMKLFNIGGDK